MQGIRCSISTIAIFATTFTARKKTTKSFWPKGFVFGYGASASSCFLAGVIWLAAAFFDEEEHFIHFAGGEKASASMKQRSYRG